MKNMTEEQKKVMDEIVPTSPETKDMTTEQRFALALLTGAYVITNNLNYDPDASVYIQDAFGKRGGPYEMRFSEAKTALVSIGQAEFETAFKKNVTESETPRSSQYDIVNTLPAVDILLQLAEEAAELSQAATKLARVMRGYNPTPITEPQALTNLAEECADVQLCVDVTRLSLQNDPKLSEMAKRLLGSERLTALEAVKEKRWCTRLLERERAYEQQRQP